MRGTCPSSCFQGLDAEIVQDAPLAGLTWFGVGGNADWLVRPLSITALVTLLKRCDHEGTEVRILGEGANLLVDDDGIDGVVVQLTAPAFRSTEFRKGTDGWFLQAGAGGSVSLLTTECGRRGLAGLEQLIGIPASLGGAIKMNAGGKFGDIGSAISTVTVATPEGGLVSIPHSQAGFAYRFTKLPPGVIVGAEFRLTESDPEGLRQRMKEISAFKSASQPLRDNSAGCMFRNPVDPKTGARVSAGQLVDLAGLKGVTHGSAAVSERHGNFITVQKNGRAADVRELSERVSRRVFDHSGIELEREVVFWSRSLP